MPPPSPALAGHPTRRSGATRPDGRRLLVTLLLALLGCRPEPAPSLRIGLVSYRASDLNGPPTGNAVQLALEEANASGGILVGGVRRQVEIRTVTIREGSPEEAVAAVQRLINQEKVCAILGPQNSDEAIPAGGVADRSGIPLLAPISSHALTTQGRPFVFRACFRDDVQGRALAQFARQALKARTAALLVEVNVAYSRTVADVFRREFTALGGRIVADTAFTVAGEDLGRRFATLRKAAADVLLLPNYHTSTLTVGTAARRAGIRSTFLGSDSWSRQHLRGAPEFDGSYMVTNWSPDLATTANGRFIAAYTRRFSDEPSETAALTYDAARLLFAAIGASGDGTPAAIQKALYGPLDFEGTSGRIRYARNGDPEKAVVVLQFKDGKDQVARVIAPMATR